MVADSIQRDKPTALPVRFDNIPAELQALDQWVLWRYEWIPPVRKCAGRWTKEPFTTGGYHAKSTDPSTWTTFAAVQAAYEAGGWDGVGLIHLHRNELTGIDLDKCRDPETGVIELWALEIVRKIDSYSEVSPSGRGLRIYAYGSKPSAEYSRKGRIEIYDGRTKEGKPGGRYLTVTGHRLEGGPQ